MKKTLLLGVFCCCLLAGCGKSEVKPEEVYDSERYLKKADEQVDKKEFEDARKTLLEVKNRDMTKKYAPIAQLKIADTYVKDGDYDLAIVEYQRFLELYPTNSYASYAQYQIAMAYYVQIESPDRGAGTAKRALKEFQLLKELYPRNPYREFVELRIEKCRTIIADGEFMIGQFYYNKGAYYSASQRFEWLLKEYPSYKRTDEVLLLMGKAYRQAYYNYKADDAFRRLIEQFPNSPFAADAKKLIRKN